MPVGNDTRRHLPLSSDTPLLRRRELLLASAAAFAAGPACARARGEKILPYNRPPRGLLPGVPRYYATTLTLDGFATGVLVLSHDGRPTKIEGNPDHPASLGAAGLFEQAAVLELYTPDRARAPRSPAGPADLDTVSARFSAPRADHGAGLRFLLGQETSPLLGDLVSRVRARFPAARFTFLPGLHPGSALAGARAALGAPALPLLDLGRAGVILALDDDLLASGPFALRYARQFAGRRRVSGPDEEMNRLYAVETAPSPTGMIADHRILRRPSEIGPFAARLAAAVDRLRPGPPAVRAALARFAAPDPLIEALAGDLLDGGGVVSVGSGQPPAVHALGQLLNVLLGRPDAAWNIAPPLLGAGDAEQDLPALLAEIDAGKVDTLAVLAPDPAFTLPPDCELPARLRRVRDVLYLAPAEDVTASLAGWVVPAAHALESWGDAAAWDGTLSLQQPLIEPLHGGRTAAEILALFAGDARPEGRRLLADAWTRRRPGDFAAFWPRALTTGVIPDSAAPRLDLPLQPDSLARAVASLPARAEELEVRFAPSPTLHDGRFAGNPWLVEHPQPMTKLSWDNAALVGPATAARLGLHTEDLVDLSLEGRRVRAPVLVVPGHADDAVTVHLGWGRPGTEAGFDANRLRSSASPTFAAGLGIHPVRGARHTLARSQLQLRAEGRPVAPFATLEEFRDRGVVAEELRGAEPSLYASPKSRTEGEQWAMTIDTTICTGCSACVAACQAENNIPVVGKDDVARGRIMHWLRIDTYLHGPDEAPGAVHEPMLCQHCEMAPCEYVCPVNATEHSDDGLNEMVYNRCVGTRFCSNNCPYKVRRFNWFDYQSDRAENRGAVTLQRNPDVTVRQRGVMEKCTYCVQRIREVEIHARVEGRAIRPGEVVTACQQACPTEAIQFGSLSHAGTRMVAWRAEPRSFEVLHELGTRPRTVYLARIDNPNPEIKRP
jgi:molybdopterin-containing oxidoreductase family iron-sulfur binding subunit